MKVLGLFRKNTPELKKALVYSFKWGHEYINYFDQLSGSEEVYSYIKRKQTCQE